MEDILILRQENTKTYDLGNNKRQLEIHIGAIHYKDDYKLDETWKDIDLRWEGNKITKAPYNLVLEDKKLILKDKKTGEISIIELLKSQPADLKWEIIPEYTRVSFRHILPSDKIPFEAKFKVTGKIPFRTKAFDDEGELPLEATIQEGILIEKLPLLFRPIKGNIRIDPTWQVGAITDDCFRRLTSSYWSLNSVYFPAGAPSATAYQAGSGARFINITVPQGKTIYQAYLTLQSYFTRTATIVNTRISAETVDDASTFADDAAAFDARWANRTVARVDWDNIPTWISNYNYNSPEIRTVIQEIIDRTGWVSGNDIVIFWEDFEDRSTHAAECDRTAESYEGGQAPILVIIYALAEENVGYKSMCFVRDISSLKFT